MKNNNFDFLRLTAASLVLFSHQYALMGHPEPGLDSRLSLGALGVAIFFTISGYLVTQSWTRDPHAIHFAVKRFLRIWPGLAVAMALAAFLVGPIVTQSPAGEYLRPGLFLEYFKSLMFIKFHFTGVFPNNPIPNAVNGSLWTIPFEVTWYGILLVSGLLGLLKRRWFVMMAFGGLVVYQYGIFHGETNPSRSYLREFGLYFIAGSVLYLFHESWKGREILIVSACALTGIAVYLLGEHALGVLILLAPLTIFTGDASTPVLRRFGRYGDLSYGVYIYAFVIQQTLIWCFSANASFILLLLAVLCITLACAWLSWHFVEKPALSLKSLLVSRMAGTLDRGVPREVNEP